jgi:hypothetical protein
MQCARCRRPITSAQRAGAQIVKEGDATRGYHGKCKRLKDRADEHAKQAAKGNPRVGANAPSAYEAAAQFGEERRTDAEYAAARAASATIAAERETSMDERRHDNWRTESTADLDDLDTATAEVLNLEDL